MVRVRDVLVADVSNRRGALFSGVGGRGLVSALFANNTARGGGAVCAMGAYELSMVGRTAFDSNSARTGGAVLVGDSASVSIAGADFWRNVAWLEGGALAAWNSSVIALSGGTSIRHSSAAMGGAIFGIGGSMTFTSPVSIHGNVAGSDGGAVYMVAPITVDGVLGAVDIFNNTAGGRAGAVFGSGAAAQLRVHFDARLVCENNSAISDGGAMYLQDGAAVSVLQEVCQSDCKPSSRGDGVCNVECLSRGCNWDGGDCVSPMYPLPKLATCPVFDLVAYERGLTGQSAITDIEAGICTTTSAECRKSNFGRQGVSANAAVGRWAMDMSSAFLYVPITAELSAMVLPMSMELWVRVGAGNVYLVRLLPLDVVLFGRRLEIRSGGCVETRELRGGWIHLAMVFENQTLVYSDGQLLPASEACLLGDLSPVGDNSLTFGADMEDVRNLTLSLDEIRIWNYSIGQAEVVQGMRTPCGELRREGLVLCYGFDNSSIAFDAGVGEISYGYLLEAASALCPVGDGTGICIGRPLLPAAGLAYDSFDAELRVRQLRGLAHPFADSTLDLSLIPELQAPVSGCAVTPLVFRGNRAAGGNGGALYQAGCDDALDGRGVCSFMGMSTYDGAALAAFELNFAAGAGGAAYVGCDALSSSCRGVIAAELGVPGLGGRKYRRVAFSGNQASGYGADVATAPSQIVVPTHEGGDRGVGASRLGLPDGLAVSLALPESANSFRGLVPGQGTTDFAVALLDGLGTVVAGTSKIPLAFVLTVVACGVDCGVDNGLRPPTFYAFGNNVSRVVQTVVCPADSAVLRFFLSGTTVPYLSRSVNLTCLQCQAGQYRTQSDGAWYCGTCLPTQYIIDPNRDVCRECPVGAICDGKGLVVSDGSEWEVVGDVYRLRTCPVGSVVIRDNSSCVGLACRTGPAFDHCYRCPGSPAPGRYSLERAAYPGSLVSPTEAEVSEAQCRPCPFGANCEKGGDSVSSLPGYWKLPLARRTTAEAPAMYKCLPDLCTGDNLCLEGHTGYVCGVCMANYTNAGRQCVLCQAEAELRTGRTVGLAVAVVVAALVWGFVSVMPIVALGRAVPAEPRVTVFTAFKERLAESKTKLSGVVGVLKILLTFYQVTSCFWTSFDVPWPDSLGGYFRGSSITMGDIFTVPSIACLVRDWSWTDRLLFYTVTPLVVALAFGLPAGLARVVFSAKAHTEEFRTLKARFFNSTLVFLFVVYPVCSVAILNVYNCKLIDGKYWLSNDLRTACPMYQTPGFFYVWTVVCTVLFPVGIPVLMLCGLYYFGVPRMAREKAERETLNAMLAKFQDDHKRQILYSSDVDVSVIALIFGALDCRDGGVAMAFRGRLVLSEFVRAVLAAAEELQLGYAELAADAAVVFAHFDVDGNGELGAEEVADLTCALVQPWHEDLTPQQIDALIHHRWGQARRPKDTVQVRRRLSLPGGTGQMTPRKRLLHYCTHLQAEQILSIGRVYWDETDSASDEERLAIDCMGFLFLSYRAECWYYELIEQFRKLLMTSVVVLFYPGSLDQLVAGIFITFIGLVLCFRVRPYMQPQLSELQATCLSVQVVTLAYGVILIASGGGSQSTAVSDAILAVNVLVAGMPLLQFFVLRARPRGSLLCGAKETVVRPVRGRKRSSAMGSDLAYYVGSDVLSGRA